MEMKTVAHTLHHIRGNIPNLLDFLHQFCCLFPPTKEEFANSNKFVENKGTKNQYFKTRNEA